MGRFQLPLAAAIAGVIWSSGASAGGFQVTELCVRCQGLRNAGAAALNDQAAGIYFNPANLAGLKAAAFDLSAHYIDGKFKFSDRGSTGATGQPAVGSGSEDGAVGTPVGSMFYGQPINDRWSWGTAITVPYGLETEYNRNWMGRYHADRSELQIVQLNPAVAFKVTDTFSLGLGVVVQHAEATLTNAIDGGTVLSAILSQAAPGLPPALLPTPSDPQYDAYARVRGNDVDWGWTAGLHWEPLEGTKLGVGYRSEIEHKLDGSLKIGESDGLRDYLDSLPIPLPPLSQDVGGTAEVDTPKTVWLGLTQRFGERWTVALGATWTEWSSFDEIDVVLASGGDIVQPEDWDDSWRYSVGAEFALNDQWTFRAGYEYDETPAQDILTPRIPDEDRDWLAVGFTWRPYLSPLAIDFAYTHIFIDDYNIDDQEPFTGDLLEALTGVENDLGSTLTGEYDADANIYSIGFRWELAP